MRSANDDRNASLVSCEGLRFGAIRLHPFEIERGQAVSLRLPSLSEKESCHLEALFTGAQANPAMHLAARVVWARPAQNRGGILGRVRWLRASEWLIRAGGISRTEAHEILLCLGLDRGVYVEQLAGTPRAQLGLEAAYARGAEVIAFETRGCDPLGVEAIQEKVRSRLAHCAALYLAYPFQQEELLKWSTFSGAKTVEVEKEQAGSLLGAQPGERVTAGSEKNLRT